MAAFYGSIGSTIEKKARPSLTIKRRLRLVAIVRCSIRGKERKKKKKKKEQRSERVNEQSTVWAIVLLIAGEQGRGWGLVQDVNVITDARIRRTRR